MARSNIDSRPLSPEQLGASPDNPSSPALALIGVLISLAVAWAHWGAMSAGALSFDDDQYLVNNRLVCQPSLRNVGRFFGDVLHPSTVQGYYQPLAMTSLMLDAALGGSPANLRPFHRTSLTLHALNAALVFFLLNALLREPIAAAVAALLFGVHPIAVESICWVGERKTLLATSFALGSMLTYVRYARCGGRWRYLAALGLFVLALLSKPSVVPLPAVLLLLDAWPLRRLSVRSMVEKGPFVVAAVAMAVLAYLSQINTYGPVASGPDRADLPLLIVFHNVAFYLYKLVIPHGMSAYYPVPPDLAWGSPMVVAGVLLAAGLATVMVVSRRRLPCVAVGLAWFAMMISPAIGVIGFHPVIAADRHAYFPMVGLLLMVVPAAAWLLRRPRGGLPATALIAMTAMALLTAESRRTAAHWRTSSELFGYFSSVSPETAMLHARQGAALAREGRPDDAIAPFRRAIELRPAYPSALAGLGRALASTGQNAEGVAAFRQALALRPKSLTIRHDLAWALVAAGEPDAARAEFTELLRRAPADSWYHRELKDFQARLGRLPVTRPTSRPTTAPGAAPTTVPLDSPETMPVTTQSAGAGDDPARAP